jgi:hypothetical protein
MPVAFSQDRVKATLKEVADPSVPPIEGLRVPSVQHLDSPAQSGFPETYEQVVVTPHQAIAEN